MPEPGEYSLAKAERQGAGPTPGEGAMREKFTNASKAASYVGSGLAAAFPDANAEVVQLVRSRSRSVSCKVKDIGPVLQRMCERFRAATVEYHPDNEYGFVAEIRAHREQSRTSSFRKPKNRRSRVLVLLTRVNGKEILVGSIGHSDRPEE
jgi:hypothetical protein